MRWLNSVNGNVSGRYRKPNLPIRGKQRAHDEKAAYPSWASSVPDFNQNRSLELSVHYIDSANESNYPVKDIDWFNNLRLNMANSLN